LPANLQVNSSMAIYTIAILILDGFDSVMDYLSPNRRPASDYALSDIDDISDDGILQRRQTMPKLLSSSTPLGGYSIVRITERTVVKSAQDFEEDVEESSEALALNMVFLNTTIPVPRVRRVVKGQYFNIIVMDYIPGRQLSEVWPSLSFFGRLRIAITLRRYIRQLRSIRHPRSSVPGPLCTKEPRMCESPIFGQVRSNRGPFTSYWELSVFFNDRLRRALESIRHPRFAVPGPPCTKEPHMSVFGQVQSNWWPFTSYRELSAFFNDKLRSALESQVALSDMGKFDDSAPLVLTHQDLNMRNLIVGDDGRLWVIDWAWAGFYPRWFEFVAMRRQAENEERLTKKKEAQWDAMIPFICDPFFRQEQWLIRMGRALDWA